MARQSFLGARITSWDSPPCSRVGISDDRPPKERNLTNAPRIFPAEIRKICPKQDDTEQAEITEVTLPHRAGFPWTSEVSGLPLRLWAWYLLSPLLARRLRKKMAGVLPHGSSLKKSYRESIARRWGRSGGRKGKMFKGRQR